ncbi:hypothetical protein STCU_05318 [Strigomonas culicis]|nr:hypothetical protein STCU_05318 [Strigomonas culicis]|eukprot:EPY28066.1 hypothetical protein STCU_05318 [Strigomonas culicis]
MKQRIHEWEGCVRDATAQTEVTAEQKAPLRSIYELYKVSKGKVGATETTRGMSTRSTTVEHSVSMAPSTTVRASDSSVVTGVGHSGTSRLSSSTVAADDTPMASIKTTPNAAAAAADTSDIGNSIPRVPIGTVPAEQLSDADLNAEKRRLKQVLHRFESEFERVKGERPNRRDRRGFTAEYHRYGQLKNEIAKREGKPAAD